LEIAVSDDLAPFTRRCERAVVTAYRDLRAHGSDDINAFRACTTLYRIHHPEASLNEARRLVAEWIDLHVARRAHASAASLSSAGQGRVSHPTH
jgi:hypothetical protein